jgi:phospholipid/cholesterol/gamma-HCH transport system substrate-binding protein
MKDSTRNIAVGLTVMAGLVILAGVVFAFTGMAGFLATGYTIQVDMDSSHGVRAGDWVHLKGIRVGKVTDVNFTQGDPKKGVTYLMRIEREYRLPATTRLVIATKGFSGSAYLDLKTDGEPIEIDGEVPEYLPMDRVVTIEGDAGGAGGGSLIPDEAKDALDALGSLGEDLGPAMKEFGDLARNLNKLLEGEEGQDQGNIRKTFARLDRVLAGMEAVFGDEQNQKNLSASLKNLAEASQAARETMGEIRQIASDAGSVVESAGEATRAVTSAAQTAGGRIDDLSESLLARAEDLSQLLQTLHKGARKLESGEGTAGKLLNDPKLFDNLVEATAQLDKLIQEMRGLVKTWKDSGVGVQLK